MALNSAQVSHVIHELAAVAEAIEAGSVTTMVTIAIHPNETRTLVQTFAGSKAATEQLILALEKVLFTVKMVCFAPQVQQADRGKPEEVH